MMQALGTVAHYNLLEKLDPVGPGELFRARDTRLGRTVSLRLLPPEFAPEAGGRGALLERIRALAALSHPNVTALFDAGEQEGRVYVVYEFLKGQTLRAEMAGRMMNVRRAVELAIQIADAVADAHAAGYVHGGLSPDSIAVTARGRVKVPALELTAHGGIDEDGGGVRLRDYDSPEEARGEAADERSDIYSVGAVLYEMLTTRRPPHRGAAAASSANRHVPPELDDVVLKAVAPNPESRFQSAASLAAELRGILALLDLRGSADEEAQHAASAGTHVGRAVMIAIVILLVLGTLAWLMLA